MEARFIFESDLGPIVLMGPKTFNCKAINIVGSSFREQCFRGSSKPWQQTKSDLSLIVLMKTKTFNCKAINNISIGFREQYSRGLREFCDRVETKTNLLGNAEREVNIHPLLQAIYYGLSFKQQTRSHKKGKRMGKAFDPTKTEPSKQFKNIGCNAAGC